MSTAAGIAGTAGRKPRILIVYHFFAHYRGGVIKELARSPAFEYVFCGDSHDPAPSGIRPHAWAADESRLHVTSVRVGPGLLFQWSVLRLALDSNVDGYIFLGDPHYVTTWIAATIARMRGRRVLFWTHGWLNSQRRGIVPRVRDLFFSIAHGLLLYGDRAKTIGVQRGFNPDSLHVIYNSLPTSSDDRNERELEDGAQAVRNRICDGPGQTLLLCPGRLIYERRLDLLIEAVALLVSQGHPARIVLVGDGPARGGLEDLARARQVPVVFVGECYDNRQLADLFGAADLTVIPQHSGLSVVQSLGFGTPVLTGDNPESEMPEREAIEPGVTGAFYRSGDATDMARAIESWVGSRSDRRAVSRRCKNGLMRRFQPAFQVKVIEDALAGRAAAAITSLHGGEDELALPA